MKSCIFGGHYGSEGKGSLSEWLARSSHENNRKLAVIGENSPNSGHTCSIGKTRNIPAASYFADVIILGPDSAVDMLVLIGDMMEVAKKTGRCPQVYVHECASIVHQSNMFAETGPDSVVERISSTGSGSGHARYQKQFYRTEVSIIREHVDDLFDMFNMASMNNPGLLDAKPNILNTQQYISLFEQMDDKYDWIFECSQGTLLDVNFGRFPYVTSRSTLPRVAIERNGLGLYDWDYFGVYRTYPIRTGGPSGPTGGPEISFSEIGKPDEIATVTKRIRRVFKFSLDDFMTSIKLTRPDVIAFTHIDYLKPQLSYAESRDKQFLRWLDVEWPLLMSYGARDLLLSGKVGHFSIETPGEWSDRSLLMTPKTLAI